MKKRFRSNPSHKRENAHHTNAGLCNYRVRGRACGKPCMLTGKKDHALYGCRCVEHVSSPEQT